MQQINVRSVEVYVVGSYSDEAVVGVVMASSMLMLQCLEPVTMLPYMAKDLCCCDERNQL